MNNYLYAKVINFCITDYCTLNCKRCMAGIPFITNRQHIKVEEFDRQLCEIFKIWNTGERLNLVGGEPLLHPHLYELIEISLQYQDHFQTMRLTTNGTIIPEDRLFELICSTGKPWDFVISDYGKQLSQNIEGLTERLKFYHIPYRINPYVGENVYFGGWVDLGNYEFVGLTEEELMDRYRECTQPATEFLNIYNGKIFECCHSAHFFAIKGILPKKTEYVDLCDNECTIEEKKKVAARFFTKPTEACRFCLGFNEKTSKRYPAAEQMPR